MFRMLEIQGSPCTLDSHLHTDSVYTICCVCCREKERSELMTKTSAHHHWLQLQYNQREQRKSQTFLPQCDKRSSLGITQTQPQTHTTILQSSNLSIFSAQTQLVVNSLIINVILAFNNLLFCFMKLFLCLQENYYPSCNTSITMKQK